METQADRIITKFRTQTAVAEAAGVGQPAVAGWKKRGLIPSRYHQPLLDVARVKGIPLTPNDFFDVPAPCEASE